MAVDWVVEAVDLVEAEADSNADCSEDLGNGLDLLLRCPKNGPTDAGEMLESVHKAGVRSLFSCTFSAVRGLMACSSWESR